MTRSHLTIALFAASVLVAGPSFAQSPASPQTSTGGPRQPASCAAAVHKAEDNIFLRIQQYTGAENRATAQVHLDLAMIAAANGNEPKCWAELRLSKQYVN